MKRIAEATGLQPAEFLELFPEPPERERKEPSIIIDGDRYLLVLKSDEGYTCRFFIDPGCGIHPSRPFLCRTYPFRLSGRGACLDEMKSRECSKYWYPEGKEKEQYIADCMQYKKEVEEYRKIAEEWNKKGGSFPEFLKFISQNMI